MLDILTVNYRNYDLLDLQLDHLSKLDGISDMNVIVVENTRLNERRDVEHGLIATFVDMKRDAKSFDGISHGAALDEGLKHVKNEFVFILDTDYFVLKKDFFPVFMDTIKTQGYDAIGPEFFDGVGWERIRAKNPANFERLPAAWGTIFRSEIARSDTWVITEDELLENAASGFVEVGWRIRKKLIERGRNTLTFQGYKRKEVGIGNCYFKHNGEDVGFHYMRASYDRMKGSVEEIKSAIK